jgi:hypothetical protein
MGMADDPDLYGLPLEEFVGARDALAKQRRVAGDRDGAAAVKALPKPTRAAWAVNRLVRDRPDEVRALLAAGEALAGAQEQLLEGADADVLRAAAQAARQLVDALAGEAQGGEAIREKVRATLHAATVDAEVRAEVSEGRLVKERTAAGFGGLDALAAALPPSSRRSANEAGRVRAKPAEPERPPEPDPREVRRRRDALRRAKEAEAAAEGAVDGARAALEQIEAMLATRRSELEAAEVELSDARERRARAERAAQELEAPPERR